jgi:hypothetical protein
MLPRSPQPDSAGIDIGANEIYVAVPSDRLDKSVRCFATFTDDLHQAAKVRAELEGKLIETRAEASELSETGEQLEVEMNELREQDQSIYYEQKHKALFRCTKPTDRISTPTATL